MFFPLSLKIYVKGYVKMKIIIIVFKSICNLLYSYRRISAIILISLIITSAASFHLFGMILRVNAEVSSESYGRRIYKVKFEDDTDYVLKKRVVESIFSMDGIPEIHQLELQYRSNINGEEYVVNGISENYSSLYIIEGRMFLSEEIKQSQNVAISSSKFHNEDRKYDYEGTTQKINECEYDIIGIVTGFSKEIFIPYTNFLNNNYDIDNFTVVFDEIPKKNQSEVVKDEILKYIPSARITVPSPMSTASLAYLFAAFLLVSLLLFFCMMNIVNLLRYWMEKNKYRIMIYKVCGARKHDIYSLIILEDFALGIFGFTIGGVLYYSTTFFFRRIEMWNSLSFTNILIIIIAYFVSIFVTIHKAASGISNAVPVDKAFWR